MHLDEEAGGAASGRPAPSPAAAPLPLMRLRYDGVAVPVGAVRNERAVTFVLGRDAEVVPGLSCWAEAPPLARSSVSGGEGDPEAGVAPWWAEEDEAAAPALPPRPLLADLMQHELLRPTPPPMPPPLPPSGLSLPAQQAAGMHLSRLNAGAAVFVPRGG